MALEDRGWPLQQLRTANTRDRVRPDDPTWTEVPTTLCITNLTGLVIPIAEPLWRDVEVKDDGTFSIIEQI